RAAWGGEEVGADNRTVEFSEQHVGKILLPYCSRCRRQPLREVLLLERQDRRPILCSSQPQVSALVGNPSGDLLRHMGGCQLSHHVTDLPTSLPPVLPEDLYQLGLIGRDARPEVRLTATESQFPHAEASKALGGHLQQHTLDTCSLAIRIYEDGNDA